MSRDIKYIGMDVHKEAIVIAVLNNSGKLVMESVVETKASSILQFIHGLQGELHVTWEEGTWGRLKQSRVARGATTPTPQLLVSLWLYAYSRGISWAREVARQCEFEPGFQWLCGLQAISHRTLSGFRSGNKAALDDFFVQVLGMLSAEGLISWERVTLDGTKIKANAGGNSFRRSNWKRTWNWRASRCAS
jgi:transposase